MTHAEKTCFFEKPQKQRKYPANRFSILCDNVVNFLTQFPGPSQFQIYSLFFQPVDKNSIF